MLDKMTEQLFDWQVRAGIQREADRELYQYAYRLLVHKASGLLLILGLSIAAGIVCETIVFIAAFMPLRQYAGGCHLKSAGSCLLFSLFVVMMGGYGVHGMASLTEDTWFNIVWYLAVLAIFFLAPVGCRNKTLDSIERKIYRFRTRLILLIECAICIVTGLMHWEMLYFAVQISHFVLACSLIVGKRQ